MVMPSFYKKPRASLMTQVEASLGGKSISEVYSGRKVVSHLTGNEKGIVVDKPRLKVQKRGGGWARVTYVNPADTKGAVTFNIRMNLIKDVMNKPVSEWFNPAEAVYAQWINNTTAGKLYTARRQVEGMLKTSIKKGDVGMAEQLEQILKHDDKHVAAFRQVWEDAHSEFEIADFYAYEEVEETW